MQESIEENKKIVLRKPYYKKITHNRTFRKTVAPLSTNKASRGEKVILNEVQKHITDYKKICKVFNDFFSNAVSDLKIPDY